MSSDDAARRVQRCQSWSLNRNGRGVGAGVDVVVGVGEVDEGVVGV